MDNMSKGYAYSSSLSSPSPSYLVADSNVASQRLRNKVDLTKDIKFENVYSLFGYNLEIIVTKPIFRAHDIKITAQTTRLFESLNIANEWKVLKKAFWICIMTFAMYLIAKGITQEYLTFVLFSAIVFLFFGGMAVICDVDSNVIDNQKDIDSEDFQLMPDKSGYVTVDDLYHNVIVLPITSFDQTPKQHVVKKLPEQDHIDEVQNHIGGPKSQDYSDLSDDQSPDIIAKHGNTDEVYDKVLRMEPANPDEVQDHVKTVSPIYHWTSSDASSSPYNSLPSSHLPMVQGNISNDSSPDSTYQSKALSDVSSTVSNKNNPRLDDKLDEVMDRLFELRAQPEQFDPWTGEHGSIMESNRHGLEASIMVSLYNGVFERRWTAEELRQYNLLPDEDDFGDNPIYLTVKLQWWRMNRGIDGLQAVVEQHLERIRAIRKPEELGYFMSIGEEMLVNQDSPEYRFSYPLPRRTSLEEQVFDALHEQPAYRVEKCEPWTHFAENPEDCLPDSLFENTPESLKALAALIEYQDSQEAYQPDHMAVPQWARPQLLKGSSLALLNVSANVDTLRRQAAQGMCDPLPGLGPVLAPTNAQQREDNMAAMALDRRTPDTRVQGSSARYSEAYHRGHAPSPLPNLIIGKPFTDVFFDAPPPGLQISEAERTRNLAMQDISVPYVLRLPPIKAA